MGGYGNKKIKKCQGIKWRYWANLYFLVLVSTRRSSFWCSSNILAQYCKYIIVALWFLLFQLFGHFSVIWFSIYLVLWMGFSGWAPLNLVLFFFNVATIHGRSFFILAFSTLHIFHIWLWLFRGIDNHYNSFFSPCHSRFCSIVPARLILPKDDPPY